MDQWSCPAQLLLTLCIIDPKTSVGHFYFGGYFFGHALQQRNRKYSKTPIPDAKNISFVSCIFTRCNYVHIQ